MMVIITRILLQYNPITVNGAYWYSNIKRQKRVWHMLPEIYILRWIGFLYLITICVLGHATPELEIYQSIRISLLVWLFIIRPYMGFLAPVLPVLFRIMDRIFGGSYVRLHPSQDNPYDLPVKDEKYVLRCVILRRVGIFLYCFLLTIPICLLLNTTIPSPHYSNLQTVETSQGTAVVLEKLGPTEYVVQLLDSKETVQTVSITKAWLFTDNINFFVSAPSQCYIKGAYHGNIVSQVFSLWGAIPVEMYSHFRDASAQFKEAFEVQGWSLLRPDTSLLKSIFMKDEDSPW